MLYIVVCSAILCSLLPHKIKQKSGTIHSSGLVHASSHLLNRFRLSFHPYIGRCCVATYSYIGLVISLLYWFGLVTAQR